MCSLSFWSCSSYTSIILFFSFINCCLCCCWHLCPLSSALWTQTSPMVVIISTHTSKHWKHELLPNVNILTYFTSIVNIQTDFTPIVNIQIDFTPFVSIQTYFTPIVNIQSDFTPIGNTQTYFTSIVNIHTSHPLSTSRHTSHLLSDIHVL